MYSGVTHLSLNNFRSYKALDIAVGLKPVVLYGKNGAGKTNILEALSLFSPGRGLRNCALNDLYHLSNDASLPRQPWVARMELDYSLQMITAADMEAYTAKRILKIQKEPVKTQNSLAEYLNVVWFTPETDRLFLDSPSARRKFVDRLVFVFDHNHLKRVSNYEHAVRERMQALKQGADATWLNSIEKNIAELGTAIMFTRQLLLDQLAKQSKENPILPSFTADMFLNDFTCNDKSALAWEEFFQKMLFEQRPHDLHSGMTHSGPHRADLCMRHSQKNQPAQLCSTGEQKALLLSLILSFIEVFKVKADQLTLFLLDDIIAHLDLKHRMLLFDKICAVSKPESGISKFQAWFTGTDRHFFEPLSERAQFFHVDGGSATLV